MALKEEEENQGFKVSDRRRFQADGTPAEEDPGAKDPDPASAKTPIEEPAPGEAAPGPKAEQKEIPADFVTLLLSLAASAQSALGISPHPRSGKLEVHLAEAKYTIDLLAILKEKTRGNLDAEEEKFLEALLYDLRLRYVEAKGGS